MCFEKMDVPSDESSSDESSSSSTSSTDYSDNNDEGFDGYCSPEKNASERLRPDASVPVDEGFNIELPIQCLLEEDSQRPPWRSSAPSALQPDVPKTREEIQVQDEQNRPEKNDLKESAPLSEYDDRVSLT